MPFFCRNKKVDATNSLAVLKPEVAAQWHPTLNAPVTPDQVVPGANKQAWWSCPAADDHVWRAKIEHRAVTGTGCPFCLHLRPSRDYNLAVLFPAQAAEWHPSLNGSLRPQDVVPGSARRVWWRCSAGHEWQAQLAKRTVDGRGCPHCRRGKKRPATTRRRRARVWLPSDWT